MMQMSIMMKAPRIMAKAPRIMPKAPRIMPKAPRIMLKAPNKMSFDHLRQLWLSIEKHTTLIQINEISEDKIAVCKKTQGLRSWNFSNLNSACSKVLVPVKIFQFHDMHYESERYRDAANGLLMLMWSHDFPHDLKFETGFLLKFSLICLFRFS
jgi:hypothetical protein